jgi:hypothetical protein
MQNDKDVIIRKAVSRNIEGEINCSGCGANISKRYRMCDEDLGGEMQDSHEFCDKCFEIHPCGKGEHGEQCATLVTTYAPGAVSKPLPGIPTEEPLERC